MKIKITKWFGPQYKGSVEERELVRTAKGWAVDWGSALYRVDPRDGRLATGAGEKVGYGWYVDLADLKAAK